MNSVSPIFYLAPAWMVFELAQLVVGERHLGIRQIGPGIDPRERGPGEWVSFFWSAGIVIYWVWMGLMLAQPVGRPQVVAMIVISVLGFTLRRTCRLKWVLLVMTFEGAIRIGMLFSLTGVIWRRL
jgi:hypothetical protein